MRPVKNPQNSGTAGGLALLIPIASFLLLLAASWRRWTSPIADSGREMELPLRLLEGEWLYRDVHYLYPPFAPYLNSLLYGIFGAHLDVLLAAGIVCAVAITLLALLIGRRILSPFDAALVAAAVIVLCIFKPSGNLISPYAYAALYGMVFALTSLLFTLRYAENGRARELMFAGVMIGLAGISKQEFGFASAATVTCAVLYLHRPEWRVIASRLSAAAVPALLIGLPVYGLAFYNIGWETLIRDCHLLYTHLPESLVYYNAQRTGMDRPLLSLLQMLGGAAVGGVALSLTVLIGGRARGAGKTASVALLISAAIAVAVALIAGRQWDGSPLRALPILLVVLIFLEWRKRPGAAVFIISIYSLAILARVTLRVPSGGAFGGFFLPTSLIIFFHLFINLLPEELRRRTGDDVVAGRVRRVARGLIILTILVMTVVFSIRYRKNFTHPIAAERGRIVAPSVTGPAIEEALRFIEANTRPSEPIAVFPEGVDLAFLTGRSTPFRHQILIPGLMLPTDERRAIETLRKVRYVLIVNRPMREFGAEAFGSDFYRDLGRFIEENYELVRICGKTEARNPRIGAPGFFIKIYRRISAS